MTASAGHAVTRDARGPAIVSPGVTAHYVALLVLEAAMLGVYMSLDLVGFVIWWFVAALAICYLCGSVATSSERSRRGRRFVDIAVIPSLVLMAAMVTLHLQGRRLIGIPTFDLRNFQQVTPPVDVQHWLFAMFLRRVRGDAGGRIPVVAVGCRQQERAPGLRGTRGRVPEDGHLRLRQADAALAARCDTHVCADARCRCRAWHSVRRRRRAGATELDTRPRLRHVESCLSRAARHVRAHTGWRNRRHRASSQSRRLDCGASVSRRRCRRARQGHFTRGLWRAPDDHARRRGVMAAVDVVAGGRAEAERIRRHEPHHRRGRGPRIPCGRSLPSSALASARSRYCGCSRGRCSANCGVRREMPSGTCGSERRS